MLKPFNIGKAFAIAAALALSSLAGGSYAATAPSTRVVVPDRPSIGGGSSGVGCYSVVEKLYGPYSMNFCLGVRGSYTVTGGGLSCNGRLTSSVAGRKLDIRLQRTSCGRGKAWSADWISCDSNGIIGGIVPFVAVPDRPGIPALTTITCTYTPAVPSYSPRMIRARRTS